MPRPSNGNVEAKNLKKIIDEISGNFKSASDSRDLVSFFGFLVAGFEKMRSCQMFFNTGSDRRAWKTISGYVDEVINRGGKVTGNNGDAVRSGVLKDFVRRLRLIHKNLPYGGLIAKYVTGAGFGEIRESLWRAIERLDVFSTNDEFIKLFGDHVVRCLENASSCSDIREFKNLVKGAFSIIGSIVNSDNNGDEFMILPKVTKDMLSSFWGKFRGPLEVITKSWDLKFGLKELLKPLEWVCSQFSKDKLLRMAAKPAEGALAQLERLMEGEKIFEARFGKGIIECLNGASVCSDVGKFKNFVGVDFFGQISDIANSTGASGRFSGLSVKTRGMLMGFLVGFRNSLRGIAGSKGSKFGLKELVKPLEYVCKGFSKDELFVVAAAPAKRALAQLKTLIDREERSKLVGKKKIN